MPPKLAALVGDQQPSKKFSPISDPLTNWGKRLKAEAKKRPKNVPRPPPGESEHPAKIMKPRSLPPPGEMTAAEEIAQARRRRKFENGWNFDKKKAITTREKLRRAQLISQAKGTLSPDKTVTQAGQQGKTIVQRAPSTLVILAAQSYGSHVAPTRIATKGKDRDHSGVLYRPTERALRYRRTNAGMADEAARIAPFPFRFLDLPCEVRNNVYRLLLVDTRHIVWPDSATGREQPDIAMTCREVRDEALEIYYRENTFGIVISTPRGSASRNAVKLEKSTGILRNGRQSNLLTGVAATTAWAYALSSTKNEDGRWFARVENWVFEYIDPNVMRGSKGAFLVSLRLLLPSEGGDIDEVDPESAGSPSFLAHAQRQFDIEVHSDATCILPAWGNCGRCRVKLPFPRLIDAVHHMLNPDFAMRAGAKAEALCGLARDLRNMAEDIGDHICDR